ncbi:MAG TPA: hypothetical protein VF618_22780 [Thermoanaerobaculia bacterium]
MKVLVRMALLSMLLTAVPAFAQMDWSAVGSTGVPDEASAGLFDFNLAQFAFRPPATGLITARYQVTNTFGAGITKMPPWNVMLMSYADNGPGAAVRARLFRLNVCTRQPQLICEIRSNDNGSCDKCAIAAFALPIDFANFVYYVEVDLSKAALADFPALYHLAIN